MYTWCCGPAVSSLEGRDAEVVSATVTVQAVAHRRGFDAKTYAASVQGDDDSAG